MRIRDWAADGPWKLAGCWTGRADHRAARWRITLRHEPPAARVAGCRLRSGQHPRRLCRRGGRRIQGRPSADVLRRPSRPVVASAGRAVGEPLVVSTDFRSTGPVDPADCHRRRGRHSRNQSIGSFQRGVARLLRNIGNPPRRRKRLRTARRRACGVSRDRERVAGAQILRGRSGPGPTNHDGAERRTTRSRDSSASSPTPSTSGCRKRLEALPIFLPRKRVLVSAAPLSWPRRG